MQKTVPYYSQLDYVLCRRKLRCMFNDARSYSGCTTKSDHRVVVARVDYGRINLAYSKITKPYKRFDCANRTSNTETQALYKIAVHDKLVEMPPVTNANQDDAGVSKPGKVTNYLSTMLCFTFATWNVR